MGIVEATQINSFGPSPGADGSILEIPASDLQGLLSELVETYNAMVELVKDSGILRGRDLARSTARAQDSLKAARSPIETGVLLCAFTRQLLSRLKAHMKAQPRQAGQIVRQAITKVQLRAESIIEHITTLAEGKEKVALDSSQARHYLAGKEDKPVSRRDCIRALHRAEKLCPALECQHRPNDGRRTMRLTGLARDLLDCDIWQRSGLTV